MPPRRGNFHMLEEESELNMSNAQILLHSVLPCWGPCSKVLLTGDQNILWLIGMVVHIFNSGTQRQMDL